MNAKHTIIIFAGIGILLVILLIWYFIIRMEQPNNHQKGIIIPTPIRQETPVPTRSTQPLLILQTLPADQATDIPLNQQIIITFNRSFSQSDFSFSINPPVRYTTSIQNNTLAITPTNGFDANVTYTYSVNTYNQPIQYVTFTATNNGITPADASSDLNDQYNRDQYPDAFLAVRTPYSTSDFSVDSAYTKHPKEHFYFTVTIKNPDQITGKQSFLNWVKSTGLSDQQIQNLDIRYQ